jgi:hypothetical protein
MGAARRVLIGLGSGRGALDHEPGTLCLDPGFEAERACVVVRLNRSRIRLEETSSNGSDSRTIDAECELPCLSLR